MSAKLGHAAARRRELCVSIYPWRCSFPCTESNFCTGYREAAVCFSCAISPGIPLGVGTVCRRRNAQGSRCPLSFPPRTNRLAFTRHFHGDPVKLTVGLRRGYQSSARSTAALTDSRMAKSWRLKLGGLVFSAGRPTNRQHSRLSNLFRSAGDASISVLTNAHSVSDAGPSAAHSSRVDLRRISGDSRPWSTALHRRESASNVGGACRLTTQQEIRFFTPSVATLPLRRLLLAG